MSLCTQLVRNRSLHIEEMLHNNTLEYETYELIYITFFQGTNTSKVEQIGTIMSPSCGITYPKINNITSKSTLKKTLICKDFRMIPDLSCTMVLLLLGGERKRSYLKLVLHSAKEMASAALTSLVSINCIVTEILPSLNVRTRMWVAPVGLKLDIVSLETILSYWQIFAKSLVDCVEVSRFDLKCRKYFSRALSILWE